MIEAQRTRHFPLRFSRTVDAVSITPRHAAKYKLQAKMCPTLTTHSSQYVEQQTGLRPFNSAADQITSQLTASDPVPPASTAAKKSGGLLQRLQGSHLLQQESPNGGLEKARTLTVAGESLRTLKSIWIEVMEGEGNVCLTR
jgi:hypothetical protein